ncbi:hypothetical protein MMSR116_09215 [Methylobacterium mesophilicum SR1.6/6]|uniref:Uncharacterized protein n=1 Tax=Methylobacterium mesophilicum SR1.6/6 TaxID=908290 RepID=A0A6B9FHG5_9HYPH|nr:hypothetical protein [Methylobacterium mesophilicum]QGY02040.1 hypothetical protein MMSR116_09215 [Methylobacterium mesophilicum SR1.6/6]
MIDAVPPGIAPDAAAVRPALLDRRCREAGADPGSRAEHIARVAAGLRSLTGGLRRKLEALDPSVPLSGAVARRPRWRSRWPTRGEHRFRGGFSGLRFRLRFGPRGQVRFRGSQGGDPGGAGRHSVPFAPGAA